ncbi:glycosyltransferase [Ferruginibacter sp. SUN106]|uniref:glycosyltransferase n=1 Tax=Ferruginibacter sp. SUN106 TaxID=2978348 RepID=UPI003D36B6BF
MKKILFTCVPADGHFNPLTGLAKHLQQQGYDVRWYAASKYQPKLQQLQMPFYQFGKALDITTDDLAEAFPGREKIKSTIKKLNFDLEHFFIKRGPLYFEEMSIIHKTFPFDLLICDVAFTGSIFIKELLKVPVISIGVLPLIESSKDLAPNGLGMVPAKSLPGKIKQSVLRWLVKNIFIKKPNRQLHRILDDYNIEHNNIFLFDLLSHKADLILQSGTPGFEYYRSDLSKNIRFIGPLLPYSNKQNDDFWYDKRLAQYKKIVLVTQGTVEKDATKIIVPALEAFKNTDTLVICTTGGSQTKELRSQYNYPNIIIEDFIPFADVMPYASVYITNGGYGGVMLSIENKLPMVVAGVHEGKNEICARVGYFKYGINLKTETPTPVQIIKAVEQVITNTIYKTNVEKLSKEFEQYKANELCTKYVAQLMQHNIISREKANQLAQKIYS